MRDGVVRQQRLRNRQTTSRANLTTYNQLVFNRMSPNERASQTKKRSNLLVLTSQFDLCRRLVRQERFGDHLDSFDANLVP